MEKRGKKGVSPIVSTVLLITIVIILAAIIFLWASKFIGESIEKEILGQTKPVESFCGEVSIRASIEGDRLSLVNTGNVPVYAINILQKMPGSSIIENKTIMLDKGGSKTETFSRDSSTKSIVVIPILLGKSGNKKVQYTCPENTGIELEL